jgi:hypothetical protein
VTAIAFVLSARLCFVFRTRALHSKGRSVGNDVQGRLPAEWTERQRPRRATALLDIKV